MTNTHKNYHKNLPNEIKKLIWVCHCCDTENVSGVKMINGIERCPVCYSIREEKRKKEKNDQIP
jgi:rubrerythrin